MNNRQVLRTGFTLVELLVVVGIIGLLVALLIPALGSVQNAGKKLQTEATFASVSTGLETYKNATGEDYPPSGSDQDSALGSNNPMNALVMNSPYNPSNSSQPEAVAITGANLLVFALAGADRLGTAGFKDLNRDGKWWDDMHNLCSNNVAAGLYALDTASCGNGTMEPVKRRYDAFIDTSKANIVTMEELALDVLQPVEDPASSIPTPPSAISVVSNEYVDYLQMPVLLDGHDFPILYYKANVGASQMVTDLNESTIGVYDQTHNAMYTGIQGSSFAGLDLGGGRAHNIKNINAPLADPTVDDLDQTQWDGSFAKYVWDRSVTARNSPVNRDSYLLISAGKDGLYGTDDDITNFNR